MATSQGVSQNGLPVLEATSPLLYTWTVPINARHGGPIKLRLRNGSVGFILVWVILRIAETISLTKLAKVKDDWGYAERNIRGSSTVISNHNSGSAADVNATQHPLGKIGTWSAKAAKAIHLLLLMPILSGVVRWGGEYHGRKDEMHLEIIGTLSQCEKVARRLMKTPRGKRILATNPTQEAVILS